ncbi:hypothetical protein [Vibrio parahaemolyticus]|uniref:hypothetical protein n=1 Tax=Vibrio parahaemolyticus TaxID=670 RepID=UPI0015DD5A80|nr:hypothetical protein [Vibrio parahaemolyticus]MBE3749886.1 hypothetical protein [Vibrio parahaemolyticus]HCG8566561.1 hypothetical protein [Vibrio parahaemolyticus]HCM0795400.1 hypothetical protein [Vibrio parahaemolyticus]
MDVLIMVEKHDELLSDLPVEWLVQEPQEITSHWLPNEFGINEELISKALYPTTMHKKGELPSSPFSFFALYRRCLSSSRR